MIQVNFPISGTIAFDIHVTDEFARNLNGYFLAMVNGIKNDEWLKKGRMQVAPTNHLTDKISILPLSKFVKHLPSIVKLSC